MDETGLLKKSELLKKQLAFASEVALLKHKAGTLKLYKTMQSLEEAVTAVGWELAEVVQGKARYAE